jgi:glycosyltransferase involved in cell wall biosynthesis
MRILSITAGAAGMYCGSCFRDNALARELMSRQHDVTLMPVYTPTRTDETNVSRSDVLFGGISVYLQQYLSLFRKTPRFLDRLWDSPRVIGAFAGRAVSSDARLLGDLTVSMLTGEQGALRKEFDKLVEWTRDEPPPDVINLPNSLLIALAAPLKRAFGKPVFVTLQGEELFVDGLVPPYREQALALIRSHVEAVDGFVAVSEYCARFMPGYLGIPASRISVVPLGIDMNGYQAHQAGPGPFRIGYFARIAPEKGLHVLAQAYVKLRQRIAADDAGRGSGGDGLRLDVAGYLSPTHAPYLREATAILERAGLAGEFSYAGELDRDGKLSFLRRLDVLSVPATYDEPKGMFLLEAMASGVPVVQPKRGAFTEVVEKTGGGLLVAVDDVDALAEGLFSLWQDRDRAATLGMRAYAGVRQHYTIQQSATRLLDVYGARTTAAPP